MIPIQDLLQRLRWDPQFAQDELTLGYYDRITEEIVLVPYKNVEFPADDRFRLTVIDAAGREHAIPFHRVRVVYRNGSPIWVR